MSTPTISNTEVPKEAVFSLDVFRQQVATYYANILHGRHLRREPMIYAFPLMLIGFTFDSSQLQPYLRILLAAKLGMEDDANLNFTYVCKKNKKGVSNEAELLLEIEVTITA